MTRILLTNDDGVHAEGLHVARAVLAKLGSVVTVVPDREMSGASHALTLNHPLRVIESGPDTLLVNGTPTDCVNLALNRLLPEPPDLVVSGINRGCNVGYDVTYSGTVAGAFEGALHGVPSVALSIESAGDLRRPAVIEAIEQVVTWLLAQPHPGRHERAPLLLNVNIPAGDVRGLRLAVMGRGGYRTEIIEKLDPRGNRYYWIGGQHAHDRETRAHSDIATLRAGYVAVTPLELDLTDGEAVAELRRSWIPFAAEPPG